MPCSHGGLSLDLPPSSLARGSSDQSTQRQRVHIGGLVEGGSGGLLSGGDAHSVWLHDLANIVISRGHSRWCPAYVQSEQAPLSTTEVTWQQCSVSFVWQPTNDLMSLPADLWGWGHDAKWALGVAGGRDARMSSVRAVPLRLAPMIGQQEKKRGGPGSGVYLHENIKGKVSGKTAGLKI